LKQENAVTLLALTTSYRRSRRYLEAGPRHLTMYIFARFALVRSFVVWLHSKKNPLPAPVSTSTLVERADADDVVDRVIADGYATGLALRDEVVQQLLTFSSMATCFGDAKEDRPFHYCPRDANAEIGPYRLGTYKHALQASPVLQALTRDPQLVDIARKYLGTEPVLMCARMWWSFAVPADHEQQNAAGQGFHYDIDGYRGLTFFFYLTDVGPSSGPHIYVRKTHRKKSLRHLLSLYKGQSDLEIEKQYGRDQQVQLCGPAGSGFAEDIFGFHKGMHPVSDNRLIVQVRYGLRDYGTGRND
jgi:hypothetical protein